MTFEAPVPTAGSYRIWIGGDIYRELTVSAGGRSASASDALNINRYQPFGPFQLGSGQQRITIHSDGPGLAPGSGVEPTPLGPVILQKVEADSPVVVQLRSSEYSRLCNAPWDWIEAYG